MIKTDDNINLQPNERIRGKHGDYEILGHVVKHGGFSAVYKAHSLGSNYGGLCAVKEIFKNFYQLRNFILRAWNLKILRRL